MITLAIESTCDDTSLALVGKENNAICMYRMLTHTQWLHSLYGWVVPELASRGHADSLVSLVAEFLSEDFSRIDSISVAAQPWLPWSITMWITAAYTLWSILQKPVYEVNHIMGHVFSILLDRNMDVLKLPYLCLTVSGGHSDIYLVDKKFWQKSDWWLHVDITDTFHKRWHLSIWEVATVWPYSVTKIVQTMDDAVWEAFDKVAKVLWWPYPWWPWVAKQALDCEEENSALPWYVLQRLKPLDVHDQFSFSGIKAQVVSLIAYCKRHDISVDKKLVTAICYRFQDVVTDALVKKLAMCINMYEPHTLGLVWWVSANTILRNKIHTLRTDTYWRSIDEVYTPKYMKYCTDNAAMIAVPSLLHYL